jgi:hypothetical protein
MDFNGFPGNRDARIRAWTMARVLVIKLPSYLTNIIKHLNLTMILQVAYPKPAGFGQDFDWMWLNGKQYQN